MKYNLYIILKKLGFVFDEMTIGTKIETIHILEFFLGNYKIQSIEENGLRLESGLTEAFLEVGNDGKSIHIQEESEETFKNSFHIVYTNSFQEQVDYVKQSRTGSRYVVEGGYYLDGEKSIYLDYNIQLYDAIAAEFMKEYMGINGVKDPFVVINQNYLFPDISQKIVVERMENSCSVHRYNELQSGTYERYLYDDAEMEEGQSLVMLLKEELENNPIVLSKENARIRK